MRENPELLVVTPRLPTDGVRGDQWRARHLIKELSTRYRITLISLIDHKPADEALREINSIVDDIVLIRHSRHQKVWGALKAVMAGKPAQVGWFSNSDLKREVQRQASSGRFSGVMIQLARLADIVPYIGDLPLIVDFVDALSLQWERRSARGGPRGWFDRLEAGRLRQVEVSLLKKAVLSVCTGQNDRRHLERLVEQSVNIRIIPNGVQVPDSMELPAKRSQNSIAPDEAGGRIVFSGNLDYFPNAEALTWFSHNVLPSLRQKYPNLRFRAVGRSTLPAIRKLAESHGVELPGFVPDLMAELAAADLAIAPLQSGAGIQNKVLEAMATGTPVVSTSMANAGIRAAVGKEILVANSAREFGAAIGRLLCDARRRATLGANGRDLVLREFSWQAAGNLFAEAVSAALLNPRCVGETGPVTVAANRRVDRFTDNLCRLIRQSLHWIISASILTGFVVLLPAIALAVRLDSPGPIFYSQQRVGIDRRRHRQTGRGIHRDRAASERRRNDMGGRLFTIWKVRTMSIDAESVSGPVWAQKNDPRITRVGRLLRKSRLDEVPQLWNVLRGEMSLIGPRPERPQFALELQQKIDSYHNRLHGLRPGVTGIAQVRSGYDTSIASVRRKLYFDHSYRVATGSAKDQLRHDLRVILRTVPTVLFGRGAS
jgi:sugar transferase (PEP-CTERM/EpsH1 system associated)